MKVHFVNSAFVTISKVLILRGGRGKLRLKVRYGIVLHPKHGPVIIDCGYSPKLYDVANPSLLLKAYRATLRPEILPDGAPDVVLAKLGLQVGDVKHVILTHLHTDHVGYLHLFPNAIIHSSDKVVSERPQARHGIFHEILPPDLLGRTRGFEMSPAIPLPFDLGRGWDIFGDQSMLAVPLSGHTAGHFGVYFPTMNDPLLYAVDTAWTFEGLLNTRERPSILKLISASYTDCVASADRVRKFRQAGGKVVLCHDPEPSEYDFEGSPT